MTPADIGDMITPAPTRTLFIEALTAWAEDSYLQAHPCPVRKVRRAMFARLAPCYSLIRDLTSGDAWEEEFKDNPEAQGREALMVGALAEDIARGVSPRDPDSASQQAFRLFYGDANDA